MRREPKPLALYGQRVFVDKRLTMDAEVSFSGGSHDDSIRMPYREFERIVQPTVAEFALRPSRSFPRRTAMLDDPVCGAPLDGDSAAGRSEHRGVAYYFCWQRCKMEFDDNPDGYATTKLELERGRLRGAPFWCGNCTAVGRDSAND